MMMPQQWIVGTGFSRGIGFEVAKLLQAAGYSLIHLGRQESGFENIFLSVDLRYPLTAHTRQEITHHLQEKSVIGLFYAAGVIPPLKQDREVDFWIKQNEAMQINYLSCVEITSLVYPFILSSSSQSSSLPPFLAHLSSLSAVDPFPGLELYGATKLATLLYYQWLANQFDANQITCLSIHPGTVYTDLVKNILTSCNKELELVKIYRTLIAEETILTPAMAAKKIISFLFQSYIDRKKAHGKLYLIDQNSIYKEI